MFDHDISDRVRQQYHVSAANCSLSLTHELREQLGLSGFRSRLPSVGNMRLIFTAMLARRQYRCVVLWRYV